MKHFATAHSNKYYFAPATNWQGINYKLIIHSTEGTTIEANKTFEFLQDLLIFYYRISFQVMPDLKVVSLAACLLQSGEYNLNEAIRKARLVHSIKAEQQVHNIISFSTN